MILHAYNESSDDDVLSQSFIHMRHPHQLCPFILHIIIIFITIIHKLMKIMEGFFVIIIMIINDVIVKMMSLMYLFLL